jgi:hypothetical protein
MSGGDGNDSTLKYILSDAHGFLQLCPFIPGALGRRLLSPGVGNSYPFVGSLWASLTKGSGLCPRSTKEAGGVNG